MELIKDIVRQFYPLLIMLACVSFALSVFFSSDILGEEGVFKGAGKVFSSVVGSDAVKNDGMDYVGNFTSDYVPVAKYVAGAQVVGTGTPFKEMFSVKNERGVFVSGSTEDDFAIYLQDIRSMSGESVLAVLSTEEIFNIEEIPAPFIYDKEQDVLYFYGSGTYMVYVKIYGNTGAQVTYEFKLPVEVS